MRRHTQAGFSLIELLVAMVVTFFIVGAVVGLLTSGQSAFKTQPERTDRQQNIRVGMDVIMRDVAAAGVGMPAFMQVFQQGLDNQGPANRPDVSGELTDQIALFANVEGHPNEPACYYGGGNASFVFMASGNSRVLNGPALVIMTDGHWVWRNATNIDTGSKSPNTAAGNCKGGTDHATIDFSPGKADDFDPDLNTTPGLCVDNLAYDWDASQNINTSTCVPLYITAGDLVGYRINNGADGVPNLERQLNLGTWQVLARGIENMQVQYVNSQGVVDDEPPQVQFGVYNTLTTQVRVTLASRAAPGKFQGASTATVGPMAIRASLTSQASPRIALWNLTLESPAPAMPNWN